MIAGVVGYTAKIQKDGVLFKRSYAGIEETLLAKDFDKASDWLTADYPNSFHIAWDLSTLADAVLSLLPAKAQDDLRNNPKLTYRNTKIFSVDRWFGLTVTKPIKGNFYDKRETNFFGINRFMPSGTPIPIKASEIAKYGDDILTAYERMEIYPEKLTSPVGVISDELLNYDLPSVATNEKIWDACDYARQMMRYEWRSAFKLGYFEKAYTYDLTSAYPSFIATLPDTDKCRVQFSDSYISSDWAIVKGIIDVNADISPFVCGNADEGHINPRGKWEGYFTKDEINWLLKRQLGTFKMIDGHFFWWLSNRKPYKEAMDKLFAIRMSGDDMVNNLARKGSQGLSGKLDQDNTDGSLGELYNPILASITRSRCRLSVADFIYNNALLDDALAVVVDSCIATKEVPIIGNGGMGSWRLDTVSPILIASKGAIWKPDKKPLNIPFDTLMCEIKKHPKMSYYEIDDKYIDLTLQATEADRNYDGYPKTGGDLLNKVYNSKAIIIGEKTDE